MTTSDKIRELIEERGLTQQQFAGLVGIHYITLNKNLINDNFSSKSLEKIASACGVSVYDLVPDKEASNITLSNVCGYLECNGEIVKIRDIKTLKKFVARIDTQERLMKIKQTKLPKQQPITLDNIILDHWEEYDATQMEVMSFRHHYDIVNGEQFNVGNMCTGYPFTLHGITFQNSEAAYIAGIYSHNNPEHIRLQEALIAINDGYKAKKEYRHTRYDHVKREDWESFNIEWMKYVVWQKCKTNSDFAELLISIPKTAMVVENSTGMTGATAQVWGCFNSELEELRDAKVKRYAIEHSIRKDNDERLNIERNRWNNYGVWSGKNLMGKIIKMCSICLQQRIELPIDYELLQSKHIHLLGQALLFISPVSTSTVKALILDFDMTLFNTRPSKEARLAKDWDKAYEQIPQFTLYDGWREVFDYTKAHGIKTILISRATKRLMERTLNHFGISCDVIIGSRRGFPSKKDANSYVLVDKALDQLQCNISRSNIISVGDSATDRTMSENAGVRFIGAIWDCEKEESYTELQKGETINNPKEIIHILESNQEISAMSESGNIVCTDEYAYFYMDTPLSNWWTSIPSIPYDGYMFTSSEALFMYLKAKGMGDQEYALKIVEADGDSNLTKKERFTKVKKLGKRCKFDEAIYIAKREEWMYMALSAKFKTDRDFREVLMSPKYLGKTFVEASPFDAIWGIKQRATKNVLAQGRSAWKGLNLLGKILTQIRDENLGEY